LRIATKEEENGSQKRNSLGQWSGIFTPLFQGVEIFESTELCKMSNVYSTILPLAQCGKVIHRSVAMFHDYPKANKFKGKRTA
jgi:hypothetical protein